MKKILIVGFGNVGKGILKAMVDFPDMEVIGIITRNRKRVIEEGQNEGLPVYEIRDLEWQKLYADIAILCGGSKSDLPFQGPYFQQFFNTVCSFDTHGHIDNWLDDKGQPYSGYFQIMNAMAHTYEHVATVCQGWDPGIFSVMRAVFKSCLGNREILAAYGLGENGGRSMGHTEAISNINGVKSGVQYTHAIPETINKLRKGEITSAAKDQMHWRECVVVLEDGADEELVRETIVNMPEYFKGVKTTVEFINQEEFDEKHQGMFHDGLVLGVAPFGTMEYHNSWDSNPLATAYILLVYARATIRLLDKGMTGAYTPLDIAPRLLLEDEGPNLNLV